MKLSLKTCTWQRQGPIAAGCGDYSQENVSVINDHNLSKYYYS